MAPGQCQQLERTTLSPHEYFIFSHICICITVTEVKDFFSRLMTTLIIKAGYYPSNYVVTMTTLHLVVLVQ